MTPASLLSLIRLRLRDGKNENYTFSDEFLISLATSEIHHIMHDFNQGASYFYIHLDNTNIFALPLPSLKILRAFLNNKPISQMGVGFSLNLNSKKTRLMCLSPQTYEILPMNSRGEVEIFYIPQITLDSEYELPINEIFAPLLVYGVLKSAFEIESNANNLERVRFYSALYKAENERLIKIMSANNANSQIETKFKKV